MEFKVDRKSINAGLRQMRSINRGITNATRRSINKTVTFARRKVSQRLAAENKVTQKVLKSRIFVKRARGKSLYGNVWGGVNPIGAELLGNPKEYSYGVKVGRHKFLDAFVATGPRSGSDVVFKRSGQSRLPLEHQKVEIEADMSGIDTEVTSRLEVLLAQELNYEVNVKGLVK